MKQTKDVPLTAEAITNAIPSTEAEFIKLILGSPAEFPILPVILSEVLKNHHEGLSGLKGKTPEEIAQSIAFSKKLFSYDPLNSPVPTCQKAKVLRLIAYRAIDEMSDYPHKRDVVLSVINSRLEDEHKVAGDTLRNFAAEISAGRTDTWGGYPAWDTSLFKKTHAKKLKGVPAKLIKMAEEDYEYWAVRAPFSEHVLWNDMQESYSREDQTSHTMVDELVLLHLVRRILAHVPASKKRDEMIAVCNANIIRHTPATGEILAKLKQEAKELKKTDAERKNEVKKKHVIAWTYYNPEKSDTGRPQHGQDSFKNLQEAKNSLWKHYSELKDEIDEGGGYFDSYNNEISVDDDGMRYISRGLVESEQEIRTQ